MLIRKIFLLVLFFPISLLAQHSMSHVPEPSKKHTMRMGTADCAEKMVWDRTSASCIALPTENKTMGMWMIHGNAFVVQNYAEGSRGRNLFSVPNMVMADVGHSYGNQYFNTDLMLTFERWTFPKSGNPLLLQIGERNEEDKAYVDSQHPHSSPIMGLTFSDTISMGTEKDYLKIFFAPRGQATEGPIAFMHRPTGMVNPDAPLGHHIGQDVSHITSTVIGGSMAIDKIQLEVSTFNGKEPEPAKVDLPMGALNSFAARLGYQFADSVFAMASASEVSDPEVNDQTLKKVWRYSGSIYTKHKGRNQWYFENALIYSHINNYDHISALRSVNEEFWIHQNESPHQYWGRLEFVERTAAQLAIDGAVDIDRPKWVTAITTGYTYKIDLGDGFDSGIGASITKDFLPSAFKEAYGGDPLSAKVFLQITGMKMGEFSGNK